MHLVPIACYARLFLLQQQVLRFNAERALMEKDDISTDLCCFNCEEKRATPGCNR